MNAHAKFDASQAQELGAGCPAEAIGQRLQKLEEQYRANDEATLSAAERDRFAHQLTAIELIDLGDSISSELDWVIAQSIRGIFVQFQQLAQLTREALEGDDTARAQRSVNRLTNVIGAALIDLADIQPSELGRSGRWVFDGTFAKVLEAQTGARLKAE